MLGSVPPTDLRARRSRCRALNRETRSWTIPDDPGRGAATLQTAVRPAPQLSPPAPAQHRGHDCDPEQHRRGAAAARVAAAGVLGGPAGAGRAGRAEALEAVGARVVRAGDADLRAAHAVGARAALAGLALGAGRAGVADAHVTERLRDALAVVTDPVSALRI